MLTKFWPGNLKRRDLQVDGNGNLILIIYVIIGVITNYVSDYINLLVRK
jgi:hypothetical protein